MRDRIRGLQTGADDYVGKPYDTSYVVARASALLRPSAAAGAAQARSHDPGHRRQRDLPRRAGGEALERGGYHVRAAATGEEGLRLARQPARRPPSSSIGCMPGIDGATLIRRVRLDAALRRTPVPAAHRLRRMRGRAARARRRRRRVRAQGETSS